MYYVYELVDPRNYEVFYVGKGCRNRIDQHEVEARKGRVSRKCDRIRAIEAAGLSVKKVKVKSFADETDAYIFEIEHIASFGLDRLTNVLPGGGSPRGVVPAIKDRELVLAAANLIARSKNGKIDFVYFLGQRLDISKILAKMKERVFEVVDRRGYDWVNKLTAKFMVEFSHG